MPYQIGHVTNPQRDDPVFESQDEAFKQAIKGSNDDSVWAVWTSQEEGSDLLALVYMMTIFTP